VLTGGAAFDPSRARATFVLSTSDYGALVVLAGLVRDLAATAPNVDLAVLPPSNDYAKHLAQGAMDVVLGPTTEMPPDPTTHAPPARVAAPAFDDRFVCLVRKGHPRVTSGLTLAQYLAFPHILVAPRGKRPSPVDVALARIGKRRRVGVLVHHFLLAPHIIA